MSLNGTYKCAQLGATLEITESNNSNGQGSGTFTIGGNSYPVNLHYHFENNVGPKTVLQIWASRVTAWDYLGAAGNTASTDGSAGITLCGGVSSIGTASGFSGLFTK
ncbi:MAG TPA: hypothetical protein DCG19_15475 [Cryomorphaceae bacterium]|nr:hypothetical protein [Owenweeksia sp.]MBF97676.1 hypothetical protein [Owenweeksia sp.]HAD98813.1 hypothetical protein [Cryomorphaceae bacterium]HBF19322.1 hypothetical protein [Cryomorphaceae bacterium]HCQ17370.1 hypothetical protein [Cryomorphaceae bacterium]|tara:strand:- start:80 stop:400 length:321 start_codon:yes stop_codon:yes gene_type:complete